MLNSTDKIIIHRTGSLSLADEFGKVSKACLVVGMSRDTIYRFKAAVDEGGVEALWSWSSPGLMDIFHLMQASILHAENEEPVPHRI